jgi:hypothetical protein
MSFVYDLTDIWLAEDEFLPKFNSAKDRAHNMLKYGFLDVQPDINCDNIDFHKCINDIVDDIAGDCIDSLMIRLLSPGDHEAIECFIGGKFNSDTRLSDRLVQKLDWILYHDVLEMVKVNLFLIIKDNIDLITGFELLPLDEDITEPCISESRGDLNGR